jgi:hypothetical protein
VRDTGLGDCPVCFEALAGAGWRRLPCKHIFHNSLEKWFDNSVNGVTSCPVCRGHDKSSFRAPLNPSETVTPADAYRHPINGRLWVPPNRLPHAVTTIKAAACNDIGKEPTSPSLREQVTSLSKALEETLGMLQREREGRLVAVSRCSQLEQCLQRHDQAIVHPQQDNDQHVHMCTSMPMNATLDQFDQEPRQIVQTHGPPTHLTAGCLVAPTWQHGGAHGSHHFHHLPLLDTLLSGKSIW